MGDTPFERVQPMIVQPKRKCQCGPTILIVARVYSRIDDMEPFQEIVGVRRNGNYRCRR